MYQDQEYVVITDIFIKQKEAHQQAKEIAEKEIHVWLKNIL